VKLECNYPPCPEIKPKVFEWCGFHRHIELPPVEIKPSYCRSDKVLSCLVDFRIAAVIGCCAVDRVSLDDDDWKYVKVR
jgi:hypothetical protein